MYNTSMMTTWSYSLASVLLVSIIPLAAILTIKLRPESLKKITLFLVSFAVGGLFGDAFIHLLPEAFASLGGGLKTSLFVITGILLFFVLEKFLRWRHCHIPTSQNHPHPMVTMNAIGDTVHNLIDGMLIGASFLVGTPLGISTALAVIAHEIPQEIGDFGVLIHGGLTPKKAVLVNLASAALAFLGVFISLTFGSQVQGYTAALVPITAGGFIYLAGSDLIPALHDNCETKESLGQFFFICLGVGVMAALTLLE